MISLWMAALHRLANQSDIYSSNKYSPSPSAPLRSPRTPPVVRVRHRSNIAGDACGCKRKRAPGWDAASGIWKQTQFCWVQIYIGYSQELSHWDVEELMLPESKTFQLLGLNCKFIFALLGNKFKTSC